MWTAAATAMAERRSAAHSGETDGHRRPFTRRAADCDRSPVLLDGFLDGRESQSGSCLLRREKRFKDVVHDFRWDRRAVILDQNLIIDASSRPMLCHVDREMPAGGHRFT